MKLFLLFSVAIIKKINQYKNETHNIYIKKPSSVLALIISASILSLASCDSKDKENPEFSLAVQPEASGKFLFSELTQRRMQK